MQWQTCEGGPIDSQGLFGRVANRLAGDPPQNKTAAPTGIGSGGNEKGKLVSVSEIDVTRSVPILAMHFGIDDDDTEPEAGQ